MRQSPTLSAIQARMLSGSVSLEGFLGTDRRSLTEILDEDQNTVNRIGLTHGQIADRLDQLAERGKEGLGTTVTVDDRFEVRIQDVRGRLACPWGHPGLYPKLNVFLLNLRTGEELSWSALTSHMIREHGFYEGRGSCFRVDPERAREVLEL